MVKKQQAYSYTEEEDTGSFVELYDLDAKDVESTEFAGKLLCTSHDKEGTEECTDQKAISTIDAVYLLKLFSNRIHVKSWSLAGNNSELKEDKSYTVPIL